MRKFLLHICILFIILSVTGISSATVLTFDDVTDGDLAWIYNGYGGLHWDNMGVLDTTGANGAYSGTGYGNGLISGDYVAFNSSGDTASMGGTYFDFTGVYMTGAWFDGLTVNVVGKDSDGIELYNQSVTVNHSVSTWFDFSFLNVYTISFSTSGGTQAIDIGTNYIAHNRQVVLENLTFTEAAPVPEPATILLLGTGLVGLVASGRKKFLKK